jgi:hypothetical protein
LSPSASGFASLPSLMGQIVPRGAVKRSMIPRR